MYLIICDTFSEIYIIANNVQCATDMVEKSEGIESRAAQLIKY